MTSIYHTNITLFYKNITFFFFFSFLTSNVFRAKIGVHVRRLAELSGLEAESWSDRNTGKSRRSKSKQGGTTVDWGDNGGASNPAAPELLRMQMEKLTKRRKKKMKKTDEEDAVHGGYWAFEYDNPRNQDVVTQADAFDFDDDWGDQFGDDDTFENGGGGGDLDDEYERPADEEEFRNVMKNVSTKKRMECISRNMDVVSNFISPFSFKPVLLLLSRFFPI